MELALKESLVPQGRADMDKKKKTGKTDTASCGAHICNSSIYEVTEGGAQFNVIFGYIVSSRSAWARRERCGDGFNFYK